MDFERSPGRRPAVLDVVLGVVVALALTSIPAMVRTFAAIRTVDSLGRLSLLAAALLFATLYWIETSDVLVRVERAAAATGATSPTHPLRGTVRLGVVALLTLTISFATVENMGWFLGVNAALWALDLVAIVALKRAVVAHRARVSQDGDVIPFSFLGVYSLANLVLFGVLTVWNAVAPWGERSRGVTSIVLLGYVLVRHVLWRPRGIAAHH